jgi:hypothetical protein
MNKKQIKLYDTSKKPVIKMLKKAIIIGQNLKIGQQKEQFLWNLAYHHCVHLT